MTDRLMPTAVVFAGGGPSDRAPVAATVVALQEMGWSVVDGGALSTRTGRLLRRRSVELVISVVGGSDLAARRALWAGSLLARWATVPFVVLEGVRGTLGELRRGHLTRLVSERVVTRCVADSGELDATLLTGIGLAHRCDTDGVGPLTLADLDEVVRLHQRCFPDSIMTGLGDRVVDRYYRWQFVGFHPYPFASGLWDDGEMVGFVFGGFRGDAVSGFARRFILTVLLGAVLHPVSGSRLVGPKVVPVVRLMARNRRRSLQGSVAAQTVGPAIVPTTQVMSFGILSIGVLPELRGSGGATKLMTAAEEAAVGSGFDLMDLSGNVGNGRAIRFYERLGWRRVADTDGWGGRMVKDLGAPSS